jgi:hypothetical protein
MLGRTSNIGCSLPIRSTFFGGEPIRVEQLQRCPRDENDPAPGPIATTVELLTVIVWPFWLWSAIRNGEIRWFGNKTRRDEEPEMFWIGCAAILLGFLVALYGLFDAISRHAPG